MVPRNGMDSDDEGADIPTVDAELWVSEEEDDDDRRRGRGELTHA